MKIKFDENLPQRIVRDLAAIGHDVDTVRGEGLAGQADDEIWRAAQFAGRFLITQDLDFSDVRSYAPGTHGGLLVVRIGRPGRAALAARVATVFATEAVEHWRGCLVIATDHKLRIKRPSR